MQTSTTADPRLPRHEARGNHNTTYGENHVAEKRIDKANPALVLADDRGAGICGAARRGGTTKG